MAFWKPGTSGPSFERDSHERGEYSSTLHVKHNITRQDLPVYAHRLELLYSIEHFPVGKQEVERARNCLSIWSKMDGLQVDERFCVHSLAESLLYLLQRVWQRKWELVLAKR